MRKKGKIHRTTAEDSEKRSGVCSLECSQHQLLVKNGEQLELLKSLEAEKANRLKQGILVSELSGRNQAESSGRLRGCAGLGKGRGPGYGSRVQDTEFRRICSHCLSHQ